MRVIYTKNHCYQPGTFLGITPVSSVSNGLYFLNLPLVSVMRFIYTSKGMSKKLGVRVIYRKIRYDFICLFIFDFLNDAVSSVKSKTLNDMIVNNIILCRISKVSPMLGLAWID